MFKRISFLVALLIIFSVSGVHAGTDLFSVKATDDTVINITDAGAVGGYKRTIELAVTNDTVTIAESGKVFLITPTSLTTFTLPLAANGLTYTFTTINGNASGNYGKVEIDPNVADNFVACINSTTTAALDAGDKIVSTGATGDSVTIVGGLKTWYCTDRIGTWTDGS